MTETGSTTPPDGVVIKYHRQEKTAATDLTVDMDPIEKPLLETGKRR